jgi:signal transduction histidine kinase
MRQLEHETRASAVLAERDRLAGEIHDSLEQGLVAIMLQLDKAGKHLENQPETRDILRVVRNMAEFSRAEVQHAVWDMQSPLLENADLATAIKHVANQISHGSPEVAIEVIGSPRPLPSSHEHHLLRIAQESINNAIRHAQARKVRVTLDYTGDSLKLVIADDGVGFVPETTISGARNGHFGLHGMRARAKKIDAQFDLASQAGRGTIVTVLVKMKREPSELK